MRWSLDFVHDQFASGRRFRILNIVDDVARECLAAIPDISISGRRVARELTTLIEQRGKPGMIVSDNGTEFTSNAMLAWAEEQNIPWHRRWMKVQWQVSWRLNTLFNRHRLNQLLPTFSRSSKRSQSTWRLCSPAAIRLMKPVRRTTRA